MAYLVTGGAGFVGSNIVRHLVNQGKKVRVIDNFSTGKRENLADVASRVEIVEADLTNYYAVRKAMENTEYVLHQAALPSVPRSISDPVASTMANVIGTVNVLTAAKELGTRRIVAASSSSIYGDTPKLPKREDMLPQPRSPYSASKLAAEMYCRVYWESYNLETVALRYFNVFGPYQDPKSHYSAVIPRFITGALRGETATVFGDGEQSRDFTFIDNVVAANMLALEAPRQALGRAFNIACGARYSLNELLGQITEITGIPIKVRHEPARVGDVKHSEADISLATEFLGYHPAVAFEEGLRRTIEWYKQ